MIRYGLATDVGKIRLENQDGVYAIASNVAGEHGQSSVGLFIVLDGMGGQGKGVEATYLAIETIKAHLIPFLFTPSVELTLETIRVEIRQALEKANKLVIQKSPDAGCVVTLAILINEHVYIGHVGDTRAYTISEITNISQITTDHTLLNRLIELGHITEEEVPNVHIGRPGPLRALGNADTLTIDDGRDIFETHLLNDKTLMLCTKGLYEFVVEEDIAKIITDYDNLQAACDALLAKANEARRSNNIAVILVKVSD